MSPSQIKRLNSLHQKKYRNQEGKILLEGSRLIKQTLMSESEVEKVWMTENYSESTSVKELINILAEKNITKEIASEKSIQRVCDSKNSQGIIALMSLPQYESLQDMPDCSLFLDNIVDPGNMGTLFRTAAWFGIDSVFLSDGCVDPFNSKVIRSGMGAHFSFKHLFGKQSYQF